MYNKIRPYFIALRPRQWTKNLIVFAAPLYAFNINLQSFLGSLLAFTLFCCVSSSFYLANDIVDVEADRQHPVKCKRPIAAKLVSIPIAIGIAILLLSLSLIIGWFHALSLGATISAYILLQVAYNLKLKRLVFLDIGTIAAGFILRANAGAAATGIALSSWFLLCTAMLALFLAVEKRKAELRLALQGKKTRAVLRKYSLNLLNRMENVVTTCSIMSYALWSSGPKLGGASTPWMLLSLPFVLYGIFRYQLISEPKQITINEKFAQDEVEDTERPDEVLLKDLPIQLTMFGWIFTCFSILWLKHQNLIS